MINNILILGMGISGKAIYKELKKRDIDVFVHDDNKDNLKEYEEIFKSLDENKIELIVKSPGIKPTNDILVEAKEKNIEIITDLELFYMLSNKNIVAITGTNGKTTTTSLIESILGLDYKAKAVGNIGVGVMDVVDEELDYVVIESSSFQLNDVKTFKPHISVITNITPDHLDWHGNFENYRDAKLNILKNQDESDYAVLNYTEEILNKVNSKVKIYYFSIKDHGLKGTFVKDGSIYFRDDKETKVFDLKDLKLLGDHNLENVLASVCVSEIANVKTESIQKALSEFAGVEHRLEFVKEVRGVKYFNDSKGTNPASTIKAVGSFDGNLILIAGGYQKNADYTELLQIAKDKLKALILLGETKHDIERTANKLEIESTLVQDLEEAVSLAKDIAVEGDNVLLSPACASWDMYSSYEERGTHFKKLVMNLNEEI
ncbi:UDP-N-acetylmuramoyl-L-alanine--D-glutamate ligase [Peptoniphilus asaccharolyticus]